MKAVVGKVKRSALYHLINTKIPINHALKAESDAMGSVIIVCLVLGGVSIIRLLLASTH